MGHEPAPTEPPAGEVRPGVERPDAEHEDEDPRPLRPEESEWDVGGHRRPVDAEPKHEAEHPHVDGAGDRRDELREPVARILTADGGGRDEDDPHGGDEQAAATRRRRHRVGEGDRECEDRPEDRERRVASRREERERLPGSDEGRDRDERDEPRPAEPDCEEDRRREERGAPDPLLQHRSGPGGQRPNRRCRDANSAIAASNASGPNSGQSVSVDTNSAYADCQMRKFESRCSPPVRITRSGSGNPAV